MDWESNNILITPLPRHILITGEAWPVHTDFRIWMQCDMLLCDPAVPAVEKITRAAKLCLDIAGENANDTINALIANHSGDLAAGIFQFYACPMPGGGTSAKQQRQEKGHKRVYHFGYDAPYIYAAFFAQYGIDLRRTELHWWEFSALLQGLCGDHKFCDIMSYRGMDLSKIKDREQRAFYRRMQSLYRLPDTRPEAEKEEAFAGELGKLIH